MSENQKKLLAGQIKEDLQKDLAEAKKEEKSKNGFGGCSWLKTLGEDCGSYRGNEWRLTYFGSDKDKYKEDITFSFSSRTKSNYWVRQPPWNKRWTRRNHFRTK